MRSTQEFISTLAGKISAQPGITDAQIRAQLQAYITQRLMPPFDAQTAYTLVESNPAGRDRELHATRFSEREIEKRRIVSAQVREGMIDCACWPSRLSMKYLSNEADVTREGRSLFYYEEPGKTDPRNREVLWLVDENMANRPAYIEEKKQQLIAGGMTEQAAQEAADAFFTDDAMRKRRSELVLSRVAECAEIARNAEYLSSDDRTPQELGQNYLTMMLALDIVNDLGVYIRQATRGRTRMEFTAEQLDYLEQRMDDQVTLRNAVVPLESIGNPCYAFLDPDDVMDADPYALISQEESLAAGQREMHKLEDPNFEQLLGGEGDLFQTYAIDAIALRGIRRTEADAREQQRMQEVYGFIPEDTVQVSEQRHQNALRTEKQTPLEVGRPVAYEMGSRVVILTAAGPNSNPDVTAGRPEALFNQTLRRRSSEIYDLLDSTDVRYKISSPEFREMKRALDKVRNVRPLGTDRTVDRQQELEKTRLRFETLLEKTNAYLGKKPPYSEKKYTNDRIQAAKKVREYAELKLRELELVEKARNTLERYKGMSDDEIRRATSAENAEIARMKAQDERRKDPVGWLGELNDRYYRQGLSQTFWHGFAHEVDELRGFERDENGVFVSDDEGALAAEAKRLAGYSVAGQLILRERAQREKDGLNGAGPLEAALHDGRTQWQQDWIQTLGEQVIQSALDVPADELTGEELSGFLASFDPRIMADKVEERFKVQCGARFVEDIEAAYKNVDPVLRNFVDGSIISTAREYQLQTLDGTLNVPHDDIVHTVACHALAELAQREGPTGEKLRRLLRSRKSADELLTFIQDDGFVKEVTAGFDQGGNTTEIDNIQLMALNGKAVIADHIMQQKQFAETLDTMLAVQQVAQSEGREFMDTVVTQYGKPPFTEGALAEFVGSHIVAPAQRYKTQMEAMEPAARFESGYRLMSSCVLAQLVQLEKGQGVLHRMLDSEEGIDTMLGLVQASKPFHDMIAAFYLMGDQPDISEIPKLVQDRQPQRAALDILKDARFKQMMEGITVPERRPVMEHDAPQKKEAPPQAGGQH